MEASAPCRARRGWRRSRAAGFPLSRAAVVLVFSALVLRAPPSGEAAEGGSGPRLPEVSVCHVRPLMGKPVSLVPLLNL